MPSDDQSGAPGAMSALEQQTFTGRVGLVTGAGTGIGAATARLLAARGAAVAVVGRPTDPIADGVGKIEAGGGVALHTPADVSDASLAQAAVDAAVARFGQLDLAVN